MAHKQDVEFVDWAVAGQTVRYETEEDASVQAQRTCEGFAGKSTVRGYPEGADVRVAHRTDRFGDGAFDDPAESADAAPGK